MYAIGNRAAFSTAEGEKVGVVSEEELPAHFLKRAKEIGNQALKALPADSTLTCIRTDIGCSDSQVHDKDYQHWNETDEMFFLNEIEYGGTTYFPRALKFDCIPLWAYYYAKKAERISESVNHISSEKLLKCGYISDEVITTDPGSASTCDLPAYSNRDVSTDDDEYDDVASSGSM